MILILNFKFLIFNLGKHEPILIQNSKFKIQNYLC